MIYGLSDLHLDYTGDKSMEVFGSAWEDYEQRMFEAWKDIVKYCCSRRYILGFKN